MLSLVRRLITQLQAPARKPLKDFPLHGFEPCRRQPCLIDDLSDGELVELNALLPWKCFTTDNHGRRFGNPAWAGKRTAPETMPDRRIRLMHERFDLSNKKVLEVGCFEGAHTIGIGDFAKEVVAVDSRVENVTKTIVRCAAYGRHPLVTLRDIDRGPFEGGQFEADVMHHVGVLYHLKDPVTHLLSLGSYVGAGIMLDTHYSEDENADSVYEVRGRRYRYWRYREWGHSDPFSGMYDHSKWLRLEDIQSLLRQAGFVRCEVVERRAEPGGPRVLLLAER